MKRTVIVAILVFMTAAAGFSEPMKDGGKMMPPMQGDKPMMKEGRAPVSLTKEEASKKFAAFVSTNLKGCEIKEINSIYMPFGAMHQATVTDKNGNSFYLDITPDGEVRGSVFSRK